MALSVCMLLTGCQAPATPSTDRTTVSSNERHLAMFGNFDLPRKIGIVPNVNLQLPAFSPDGEQMLYLRTECAHLSPMTLLGSPDPRDTPTEGDLSIWLRPVSGSSVGRQLSHARWAHSPVWSASGCRVLYVVNEPSGSHILHANLDSGEEHRLGLSSALNCFPRFSDDDENTILFASSGGTTEPFRVYRETIDDLEPTPLTPPGVDCLFPLVFDSNGPLLCALAEGDYLKWSRFHTERFEDLVERWGTAHRPDLVQTFAGIGDPRSPDGQNILFYDASLNRVTTYHGTARRVVRHRQGSIAACWLNNEAIALATDDGVFLVNTTTGLSPGLFNGAWIPCRYVPLTHRLLLLGKENTYRLSIVEVVFKPT